MPAKDHYHNCIVHALQKDGWTITHDPLFIEYGQEDMYVDIGAERLLAAERGTEKIAVEIKSFVGSSTISQLHNALGQYQVYLAVLEKIDPDRRLYLALSQNTFEELSTMDTFDLVVSRFGIAIIVVRIVEEEIAQWIV